MFSEETLANCLSAIELAELPLLRWGIVEGALTVDEVHGAISAVVGDDECESILAELLDRRLVLVVPAANESMPRGYRSRMAETIRLLKHLRQTFRSETSEEGRDLVADFHLIHRPRSRPKRDQLRAEVVGGTRGWLGPHGLQALENVLPSSISKFQKRSIETILSYEESQVDTAVMISAGTGAGKTLAFYAPVLARIAEEIAVDRTPNVKLLAIYPRAELLKDQMSTLLALSLRIGKVAGQRPLRIGSWFGDTPTAPMWLTNGWTDWERTRDPKASVCPYLRCPEPDCGGDLIWLDEDQTSKTERLRCRNGCGFEVNDEYVSLTRSSAIERPPDVMLATTESVNRQLADPSKWDAFGLGERPLKYVLLDEIHTYDGVSGAQSALLMRRLRKRIQHRDGVLFAGLSATLANPREFIAEFVGVAPERVSTVDVAMGGSDDESERVGAEYLVAIRNDPSKPTGVLSTTIQTSMLMARMLDAPRANFGSESTPSSAGLIGKKTFVFTDKLDVTNRLYWDLNDAEGWWETGKAKDTHVPKTLAHLRSGEQTFIRQDASKEPKEQREAVGQWWWAPQEIGHRVEADRQLRVGRTSSQDSGVTAEADVVIATASLEVGYDDDEVGAVIQHKAPHDPARFIQRRGRAGRRMEMRPWTIVSLASWGHDLRAWNSPEELFDPELRQQTLPQRNRHVLKMQAVYSSIDWFAEKMFDPKAFDQSTWADLAGPANLVEKKPETAERRRNRQDRLAALIREILRGGSRRRELETHLRRSLGLSEGEGGDRELESIMWSPPRAVLSTALATALRRLQWQWKDEDLRADSKNVRSRVPLPEFVTGNFFGELLLPEVEICIPGIEGKADRYSYLPAERMMRELMPGNVTHHFGVDTMDRRHWVAVPLDDVGEGPIDCQIDISQSYDCEFIGHLTPVDDPNVIVDVYRPLATQLERAPMQLKPSSTVVPDWCSSIRPIGSGQTISFGSSSWNSVIQSISVYSLSEGSGAQVIRYATTASGQIRASNDRESSIAIDFSHSQNTTSHPIGLGYDMEVDAIGIEVCVPTEWRPNTDDRRSWFFQLVEQDDEVDPELTLFERQKLASALLVAMSKRILDPVEEEFADELIYSLEDLGFLALAPSYSEMSQDEVRERWVNWAKSKPVQEMLVRNFDRAQGDVDADWTMEYQRQFSASVADCLVNAASRATPELDLGDLTIDVSGGLNEDGVIQVWISELTAGGNGQIELFANTIRQDLRQFMRLVDAELNLSEIELCGQQISAIVQVLSDDRQANERSVAVQNAWRQGHESVVAALGELRTFVKTEYALGSRESWARIGNRLLGPGTNSEMLSVARHLDIKRSEVVKDLGIELTVSEMSAAIAIDESMDDAFETRPANCRERVLRFERILWPTQLSSAFSEGSLNRFGSLPPMNRAMIRPHLQRSIQALEVQTGDLQDLSRIRNELSRYGEVTLRFGSGTVKHIRHLLLELQEHPTEAEVLEVYPRTSAISWGPDRSVDVTLTLLEIV